MTTDHDDDDEYGAEEYFDVHSLDAIDASDSSLIENQGEDPNTRTSTPDDRKLDDPVRSADETDKPSKTSEEMDSMGNVSNRPRASSEDDADHGPALQNPVASSPFNILNSLWASDRLRIPFPQGFARKWFKLLGISLIAVVSVALITSRPDLWSILNHSETMPTLTRLNTGTMNEFDRDKIDSQLPDEAPIRSQHAQSGWMREVSPTPVNISNAGLDHAGRADWIIRFVPGRVGVETGLPIDPEDLQELHQTLKTRLDSTPDHDRYGGNGSIPPANLAAHQGPELQPRVEQEMFPLKPAPDPHTEGSLHQAVMNSAAFSEELLRQIESLEARLDKAINMISAQNKVSFGGNALSGYSIGNVALAKPEGTFTHKESTGIRDGTTGPSVQGKQSASVTGLDNVAHASAEIGDEIYPYGSIRHIRANDSGKMIVFESGAVLLTR